MAGDGVEVIQGLGECSLLLRGEVGLGCASERVDGTSELCVRGGAALLEVLGALSGDVTGINTLGLQRGGEIRGVGGGIDGAADDREGVEGFLWLSEAGKDAGVDGGTGAVVFGM